TFHLKALVVPDAHAHISLPGRFEHDHLIATDAVPAVGDGPRLCLIQTDRMRPCVKHDEVIAEPVHLAEWYGVQPCHGPAYMGFCLVKASPFGLNTCGRAPLYLVLSRV